MTDHDRKKLEDISLKILEYAKTKENPKVAITDFLVSVSINSMLAEREQWEKASKSLNDKEKEILMKVRFTDENSD